MITNCKLPDMQKKTDGFIQKNIEKVGVRGIKLPMNILTKNGGTQSVNAIVSSYCNLVKDVKGINMSRISRTIINHLESSKDSLPDLNTFAFKLKEAHDTDDIYVKAKFQYLVKGESPISKEISYEPVDVIYETSLRGDIHRSFLTIIVTGMSLCPCSKEMSLLKNNVTPEEQNLIDNLPENLKAKVLNSGFGAHNQNSIVKITVEINPDSEAIIWIEDLIDIVNKSVSSPVFNTLKRADEKYVTEVSYQGGFYNDDKELVDVGYGGPKFVEDIVRCVTYHLDEEIDNRISDYVVVVDNAESIHPEAIYATAISHAGRQLR